MTASDQIWEIEVNSADIELEHDDFGINVP
jgi:hypothetical protein